MDSKPRVNIEYQSLPELDNGNIRSINQFNHLLLMERYTDRFIYDSLRHLLNAIIRTIKKTALTLALRREALTILPDIPMGQQKDYTAVVAALETRFGSYHLKHVST